MFVGNPLVMKGGPSGWITDGGVWKCDAEDPVCYPLADTSLWYNAVTYPVVEDSIARAGGGTGPVFTSSSPKHFTVDGSQYFYMFRYGDFIETLHKENANFTVAAVIYVADGSGNGFPVLMNIHGSTDVGIQFWVGNGTTLYFNIYKGGGGSACGVTKTISTGAWHFVAVSVNEATGAGLLVVDDSVTAFDATYNSPSSAASSRQPANILAMGNGFYRSPANNKIAIHAAWNRALSSEELAACKAAIASRYGI